MERWFQLAVVGASEVGQCESDRLPVKLLILRPFHYGSMQRLDPSIFSVSLHCVSFFRKEMNQMPDHCVIQSLSTKALVWSNRGSQCWTACPRPTSVGRLCVAAQERKDINPLGGSHP